MEMMNVESSMFTELGYDEESHTLMVRFTNGSLYAYHHVPESVWNDMQAAYSMGGYFSQHIRNDYTFEKLED